MKKIRIILSLGTLVHSPFLTEAVFAFAQPITQECQKGVNQADQARESAEAAKSGANASNAGAVGSIASTQANSTSSLQGNGAASGQQFGNGAAGFGSCSEIADEGVSGLDQTKSNVEKITQSIQSSQCQPLMASSPAAGQSCISQTSQAKSQCLKALQERKTPLQELSSECKRDQAGSEAMKPSSQDMGKAGQAVDSPPTTPYAATPTPSPSPSTGITMFPQSKIPETKKTETKTPGEKTRKAASLPLVELLEPAKPVSTPSLGSQESPKQSATPGLLSSNLGNSSETSGGAETANGDTKGFGPIGFSSGSDSGSSSSPYFSDAIHVGPQDAQKMGDVYAVNGMDMKSSQQSRPMTLWQRLSHRLPGYDGNRVFQLARREYLRKGTPKPAVNPVVKVGTLIQPE